MQSDEYDDIGLALLGDEGGLPGIQHRADLHSDGLIYDEAPVGARDLVPLFVGYTLAADLLATLLSRLLVRRCRWARGCRKATRAGGGGRAATACNGEVR